MRRKVPAMLLAVVKVAFRLRTVLFTLFVIALVITFTELSQWQWGRHVSRAASNQAVRSALGTPPRPLRDVLPITSTALPSADAWRKVEATGHYDTAHQLMVRYRDYGNTDDAGWEVLTPLVTAHGMVWIDRGWLPAGPYGHATSNAPPPIPAPPAGLVTVSGYLRPSEPTRGQVLPGTGQIRTIELPILNQWYGQPAYQAYVARIADQPTAAKSPKPLPVEHLGGGPYLFYSIQWLLFALIAVLGWMKLMFDDVMVTYTGKPKPHRGHGQPPPADRLAASAPNQPTAARRAVPAPDQPVAARPPVPAAESPAAPAAER